MTLPVICAFTYAFETAEPCCVGSVGNPNTSPFPLKVKLAAEPIVEVAKLVIVLLVSVSVVDAPTMFILLPAALSIAHLVSLWSNTNCAFVEPALPTLKPASVDDSAVEPVKFKSMIGSSTANLSTLLNDDEP